MPFLPRACFVPKGSRGTLIRALPIASKVMEAEGIEGELSLIKNCRITKAGNTYGSQESYDEIPLAKGKSYWSMVALLIAYVPVALLF